MGRAVSKSTSVFRFSPTSAAFLGGVCRFPGPDREPLVIALTGTTGTGKTLAAETIARALSTSNRTVGALQSPEALVYISGTSLSSGGDVHALRERVETRIAQGLYECHGQAIVVIDEGQFAKRGVMDVLLPLLRGRYARMEYRQNPSDAVTLSLDARGLVLILISDVGQDEMESHIALMAAAAAQTAPDAPPTTAAVPLAARWKLQRLLREQLSKRTLDAGVDLGQHVGSIVPFLPFTQLGVRQVLQHMLHARLIQHPSRAWHEMMIPDIGAVAEALSDPAYTLYEWKRTDPANLDVERRARASVASVQPDGSTTVDASPATACARIMPAHAIATYGARGLSEMWDRSPLDRLLTAMRDTISWSGWNASATTTTLKLPEAARIAGLWKRSVLDALLEPLASTRANVRRWPDREIAATTLVTEADAHVQVTVGVSCIPIDKLWELPNQDSVAAFHITVCRSVLRELIGKGHSVVGVRSCATRKFDRLY